MGFLKKTFPLCAGKPKFLVERGPWYEKAFKRMGVRFQRMTHGLRNSIEQYFGLLKARTKRFHNSFPNRSSVDSTRTWTDALRNIYQLNRRIIRIEEVLS